MSWMTLSLAEWQRRPLRTGLTVAGVAIAVAAMFSLLSFERGYQEGVHQELDRLGAHVLVVPKGCPYDAASIALHGAKWPCYLKARYLDEVRAAPGVATAAPAMMSAFYDEEGRQTVYVGIDTNMVALKPSWRMDGVFPTSAGDLLVGSEVAQRQNWRLGDEVDLPGLKDRQGTVRGILAPTRGPDDTFIFLRLPDAQAALKRPEELTHILVRLADPNQLDAVVHQLRGCDAGLYMNIVPLAHLFRTIQGLVRSTRVLLGCLVIVALLVAGTGVGNSLLMAMAERTREIGVLRAVGASRAQVFRLFWLFSAQVCIAGGLAGVLLAFVSSGAVETWIRSRLPYAPGEALLHWHTGIAVACVAAAALLGTIAGFLPAYRAAQLSPVEAMRERADAL